MRVALTDHLAGVQSMLESSITGEVRIHIHRAFALDEVPAALAHVGEGRASGKVVVVLS
jgi:NADPH:quinone reductase-like Zn-dependent oxidoreductase